MTLKQIYYLIYAIVISIVTILALVQTIVLFKKNKTEKVKKYSDKEIEKSEKENLVEHNDFMSFMSTMTNKVMEYIMIAEKTFSGYKGLIDNYGDIKINDVLTKIKQDCISAGRTFDEGMWRYFIQRLIEFTKNVNAPKDTKETTTTENTIKEERLV